MLLSCLVGASIASVCQLALLWKELLLSSGFPVALITVPFPRPNDTSSAVSLMEKRYSQIALEEPRASQLYLDVRSL